MGSINSIYEINVANSNNLRYYAYMCLLIMVTNDTMSQVSSTVRQFRVKNIKYTKKLEFILILSKNK